MPQKYGLLVGCTYPNTEDELKGCIHDVNSKNEILIKRFGFEESNIEILTDNPGSENLPTAYAIKAVLNQFFSGAKSGDLVFLFFAGNGATIPAPLSASGKDEQAIVPCDFNGITSVEFWNVLRGAPKGVTFVFMSDSCNSGGLIDKENEQIGPEHPPSKQIVTADHHPRMTKFKVIMQQLSLHSCWKNLFYRPLKPNHGILLSGCQPDELSYETTFDGTVMHGDFTWAVLSVLKEHLGSITNRELVLRSRNFLEKEKHEDQEVQHPCLYCSDKNAEAFFLCQNF